MNACLWFQFMQTFKFSQTFLSLHRGMQTNAPVSILIMWLRKFPYLPKEGYWKFQGGGGAVSQANCLLFFFRKVQAKNLNGFFRGMEMGIEKTVE